MGAKIGNFLATLLLSVPLAAIGLMAVFGIPQLVPALASPERDGVIRGVRDAFPWPQQPAADQHADVTHLDDAPAFSTASAQSATPPTHWDAGSSSAPQYNSETNPSAGPHGHGEHVAPPQRGNAAQSPRHWSEIPPMPPQSRPDTRALASNTSAAPPGWADQRSEPAQTAPATSFSQENPSSRSATFSWRQASLRLTELGISQFHLESGSAPGSFLFVCVYSPGDAPHVTHRFEAEAEEPLLAVNRVIQQVDEWMQERFAASNFPTRGDGMSLSSESLVR